LEEKDRSITINSLSIGNGWIWLEKQPLISFFSAIYQVEGVAC
jgi:hypothetical protein